MNRPGFFYPIMRRALFCLLLLLATPLQAKDRSVELASGEWPPYISEQAPDGGFCIRLARAVLQRAGYTLHVHYTSWPQAEAGVRSGRFVAALPYRPTPERMREFDFSRPFWHTHGGFFYLRGRPVPPTPLTSSLEELKPYRIGVQRGFWYLPQLEARGLKLLYTDDELQALKQLQRGHLDLAPIEEARGWYLIRQLAPEREQDFGYLANPLDTDSPLALMFSRSHPDAARLRVAFNTALEAMEKDGSLRALTPPR